MRDPVPSVVPGPAIGPARQRFRDALAGIRAGLRTIGGIEDEQWGRVVMNRETLQLVSRLEPHRLSVLEISGSAWSARAPFAAYRSAGLPDFDVCEAPLAERFDLIIAEQVFEHLLRPYRAARHVHAMLVEGGHFLITTPFLVRVHEDPHDCTRWTETGLRHFLAECGFPLDSIVTGSWGNRACVEANWVRWRRYARLWHSLHNEPAYPWVVWALARRGGAPGG